MNVDRYKNLSMEQEVNDVFVNLKLNKPVERHTQTRPASIDQENLKTAEAQEL